MIRLEKHEEIVEAMESAIRDGFLRGRSDKAKATAALDALLAAVLEKGVGEGVRIVDNPENDGLSKIWSSVVPTALILKLEPKP